MACLPCAQYAPPISCCPFHVVGFSTQLNSLIIVQFKSFISSLCNALYLLINLSVGHAWCPSAAFIFYLSFTSHLRLNAFSLYFVKYHLKRLFKGTTNMFKVNRVNWKIRWGLGTMFTKFWNCRVVVVVKVPIGVLRNIWSQVIPDKRDF